MCCACGLIKATACLACAGECCAEAKAARLAKSSIKHHRGLGTAHMIGFSERLHAGRR